MNFIIIIIIIRVFFNTVACLLMVVRIIISFIYAINNCRSRMSQLHNFRYLSYKNNEDRKKKLCMNV